MQIGFLQNIQLPFQRIITTNAALCGFLGSGCEGVGCRGLNRLVDLVMSEGGVGYRDCHWGL